MRDRNMSNKHDSRHDSRKSVKEKSRDNHNSDSYRHVLKERHYKDDDKNKRKDQQRKDHDKDLKHSEFHSHKRRRSHSPPSTKPNRESSNKKSDSKSDSDRRSKSQREKDVDESYEELSRRKRKLESELRALDLAEAAEKEAENKKVCRDKPHKSSSKVPEVHIKKEPVSDDEQNKSSGDKRSSSKKSHRERTVDAHVKNEKHSKEKARPVAAVKVEKDKKHKNEASASSEDSRDWGKKEPEKKPSEKEKPNFETSGKLAAETNTYNGVVIKYNEPAEARKPKRRWRLYPFKGESDLPFIPIHRQSAYLFGRTRLIADIPIDHPSCSKQHAVLQFRLVPYKREDGTTGRRVRPYIIDLESSNGTYVNNSRVDPRCYVELCEKDVIKFGFSSREYVILHEESKFSDDDDDVQEV